MLLKGYLIHANKMLGQDLLVLGAKSQTQALQIVDKEYERIAGVRDPHGFHASDHVKDEVTVSYVSFRVLGETS